MFVTNWISTTKIQKISEITNFFRHYFLSRTEVIIDKIDDLICPLYGLSAEETNFIENYEIEFRLSGEDE